jgi:hypothetical protein
MRGRRVPDVSVGELSAEDARWPAGLPFRGWGSWARAANFPAFVVELRHLGGRLAHPPAFGNAVGNRDARYLLNVVSRLERADIAEVRPAHKAILKAVEPWSTGGRSLNFMNGEMDSEQVRSAYDLKDY